MPRSKRRRLLIGLLDSDDYYEPRKFAAPSPASKTRLAWPMGVRARRRKRRDNPAPAPAASAWAAPDELARQLHLRGATLFRRSCVETGLRFDSAFRTIGEYPLWLKIARDFDVRFVDERSLSGEAVLTSVLG